MLRRLATLALSLSLATTALTSTASARAFAQAPSTGAAAMPQPADRLMIQDEDTRPRISPAARAKLRKVLLAHRAKNVKAFRAYADRGVYPHNFVTGDSLNVWIDEEGHMCAAATMIFKSGAKKLVRAVGNNDNYIRLGDVTEGPVMDWILTSGLTQSEVAMIQEPFMGRQGPDGEPIMTTARAWRSQEDARLKARYAVVLTTLASNPTASVDAAIDALAARPDLVAKLLARG